MGKVRTGSQHRCRARALWILALPLLTNSCSLFGAPVPEQEFELTVAVAPSTAAYLIADLCRRQIRGADPLPTHAFAPVVSLGRGAFAVRYSRYRDDGFRVFLNGRISPPQRPAPTAELAPCPLYGCRFAGAGERSGSPLFGDDELHIRIEPRRLAGDVRGCHVEVYLYGLPAEANLLATIRQSLAAATAIQQTAALLAGRQFQAADRQAAAAITAFGAAGNGGQSFLLSRLLVHRAVAAATRGDLLAVRSFLGRALDHDDRLQAARYWLFCTDKRLANLHDAGRSLLVLAYSELPEPLRSRARASLVKSLRNQHRNGEPELFEQRARQALAEWDLQAAYAWARRAIAAGSTSADNQAILARVHALRAQHRLAFEEELLLFTSGHQKPKLVAKMAERQLELKNAPAGLRLLAQHWKEVHAADPAGAKKLLERLLQKIGPELACRILVTMGAQELAQTQLRRWRATGGAGNAAIPLLERVPALRGQQEKRRQPASPPSAPKPRTGFETAPGVSPQR
ncbi:MAG: hypothetical protein ACYTGW_02490 [Planctomycetota bacterium]|jgi:hypothetical protein